jgi:predicted GNAT family acetyltransferase
MDPVVSHNPAELRYEIHLDGQRIGLADYELNQMADGNTEVRFVHTEIDPALRGKNYAAILMREALADVRAKGNQKVTPVCSYVVMYMKRHPETQDLLTLDIDDAVAMCRLPKSFFKPTN